VMRGEGNREEREFSEGERKETGGRPIGSLKRPHKEAAITHPVNFEYMAPL
jgi:hypothetical protein